MQSIGQFIGHIIGWIARFFRQALRLFLRPLAVICLLIASIALASDLTKTTTSSGLRMTPAAEHWRSLAPQSLANTQAFVQRTTHKLVWTAAVSPVLHVPTWLFFGVAGVLAAVITRRRREVNIYAN
jgi:hypothetical protein